MIINLYLDSPSDQERILLSSFTKSLISFVQATDKDDKASLLLKNSFPTELEGQSIIKAVREAFDYFLKKYAPEFLEVSLRDDEQTDLSSRVGLSILRSLEDAEENGNSWYWFAHSGQTINQ